MTNQEKDLKNAREYLEESEYDIPHLAVVPKGTEETISINYLLSEYVQWLEQKGVIKFNENRHN